jgi:CheY-like chemotaxis protein
MDGPPGILVVARDAAEREALAGALRRRGYPVRTAHDGLEALARLREVRPALVVLDMILPRMSGWEFMAALAREGCPTPVIILSAARGAMPRQVALGSAVVLEKPFVLDALLPLVERYCRRPAA